MYHMCNFHKAMNILIICHEHESIPVGMHFTLIFRSDLNGLLGEKNYSQSIEHCRSLVTKPHLFIRSSLPAGLIPVYDKRFQYCAS